MLSKKVVLSLSGGIDSTTLFAKYLSEGYGVTPVFFVYPSQHNRFEKNAAVDITTYYHCSLNIIDVTSAFSRTESGLFSGHISYGSYNARGMALTVVPGRNLIFASILASIAQTLGRCNVAIGVHAGDHELYPDCREEWVTGVDNVFNVQSEGYVRLDAPFSAMTKKEIVALGKTLKVPYHLTRSCYGNEGQPCHKCGTCIERDEALSSNGYTLEGVLR